MMTEERRRGTGGSTSRESSSSRRGGGRPRSFLTRREKSATNCAEGGAAGERVSEPPDRDRIRVAATMPKRSTHLPQRGPDKRNSGHERAKSVDGAPALEVLEDRHRDEEQDKERRGEEEPLRCSALLDSLLEEQNISSKLSAEASDSPDSAGDQVLATSSDLRSKGAACTLLWAPVCFPRLFFPEAARFAFPALAVPADADALLCFMLSGV